MDITYFPQESSSSNNGGGASTPTLAREEITYFPTEQKTPEDALEARVKGPLWKELAKTGGWLGGQFLAFPAGGLMGLGELARTGSFEEAAKAVGKPGQLVSEYLGTPITEAIEQGLHKASEFSGERQEQSEVIRQKRMEGIGLGDTEIGNLKSQAMARTLGETLIPAAMGRSMAGGLAKGIGRPSLKDSVAKLEELRAQRPDMEPSGRPKNAAPIEYFPDQDAFKPQVNMQEGQRYWKHPDEITPEMAKRGELPMVELTLEERAKITGRLDLVDPKEIIKPEEVKIPPRQEGIIEYPGVDKSKPIEYRPVPESGAILEKQQTLPPGSTLQRSPFELSGKPGAEGIDPLTAYLRESKELFTFDPTRALDFIPKAQEQLTKKLRGLDSQFKPIIDNMREKLGEMEKIYKSISPQGIFGRATRDLETDPITLRDPVSGKIYQVKDKATLENFIEIGRQRLKVAERAYGDAIDLITARKSMLSWQEAQQRKSEIHPDIYELMRQDYEWAKEVLHKKMPAEIKRLPWGGEDITGKLYTFNPLEALSHIVDRHKSLKEFERKLVESYGEDIRPHAKSLYAAAKQEARERKANESSRDRASEAVPKEGLLPSAEVKKHVDLGGWDRRSGRELVEDFLGDSGPSDLSNSGFESISRLLNQGQKYARNHPILNWAYSKLDWTERDINYNTNKILYGDNFVSKNWSPFGRMSSLRFAKREADPNSMMYKFHKLSNAQKEKVMDVGAKYDGIKNPTKEDLARDGLTMPEIEAYENIRTGLDKFWDEHMVKMSENLKKSGQDIQLPQKLPGFLPATWFGPYRVWGKNKQTGERFVHGANSFGEAKRAIKQLQKDFPDYEFRKEDITNIYKEFTSTPDAFLDAIRLFGRNSETGKALYEAMQDITMRRGFSRHRLARNEQRVKGYAGSFEKGISLGLGRDFGRNKRIANFERSLEYYIETGMRYVKNKETIADMDVALKDPKFREKYPNASDLAENMRMHYLGQHKFIDKVLDDVMIKLGQNPNLPKNTLGVLAGLVMYTSVLMLRAPFYVAQGLQGSFVLPRLSELKAQGVNGSLNEALVKGFRDWVAPSPERIDQIRWMVKHGIVDPKFAEQITFIPAIRGKKPNIKDVANTVSGNRLAAAIDSSVRLKATLDLLNFFESAGIKGQKALELAARHSLDVMVEYEAWKRAPMFKEMGIMGNVFSPLTTFTSNLLNRFTDYAKDVYSTRGKAEARRTLAPIASVAGIYLFLSGLYGFPFRQDIDNAIDALNRYVLEGSDNQIPSLTDYLISKSDILGDVGLFGVPSGLSGWQVGGSLGSPEILSNLIPGANDPVPQYAARNVGNIANLAGQQITGAPITESQRMEAWKGAAPTAPGAGMIENYFSPQNPNQELSKALPQMSQSVTVPGKDMEGGYSRSPSEQVARLFGVRSTKESLDQIKKHRMKIKEESMERQRGKATDLIVDSIMRGKELDNRAINKFLENGGDPNKLLSTVTGEVERRILTWREQESKRLTDAPLDAAMYRRVKLLEEFRLLFNNEKRGEIGQDISPVGSRDVQSEISRKSERDVTNHQRSFEMLYREAEKRYPGDDEISHLKRQIFVREWLLKKMDMQKDAAGGIKKYYDQARREERRI